MQRANYTGAMTKAIRAAKVAAAIQAIGGGIGLAARIFALPFLAIYAWNGLTPEGWAHWEYWPAVAGFAVVNVLIASIRGSGK